MGSQSHGVCSTRNHVWNGDRVMFSEARLKHWTTDYKAVNQGDSMAVPFVKYIELFRGVDVLEIGPGEGRQSVWAWALAKSYSIADISEAVLNDSVFQRDGLKRYHIKSYDDDFGVQFEFIHFWYVLHHILPDELKPFFQFVHRHTKSGGELLFNTPYLDWPSAAYGDDGILTSRHTLDDVSRETTGLFRLKKSDGSLWRDSNGFIMLMRKE